MGGAAERIAVVMNPHSANGRTARQWAQLEDEVRRALGGFALFPTERPGHATELVRQALHDGFQRIVSVGGDGTHFEVLNGFFEGRRPINPECTLALLPMGTGSDLRRNLRLPEGREAIEYLASEQTIQSDVGHVTSTAESGEERSNYFFNSVHIGLGGTVSERVNRKSKALGGFLSFLIGLLEARMAYSLEPMTADIDGETVTGEFLEIVAANGQYDGGGMLIAPHARLDDGLLQVYTIGKLGLVGTPLSIYRLYKGTLDKHPAVRRIQAKRITIQSPHRVLVSPDGEPAGQLPATIEIIPAAIRLIPGPNPPVL